MKRNSIFAFILVLVGLFGPLSNAQWITVLTAKAPAASSAPPAFRSSATTNVGVAGNITISKPTGTTTNDVMVACVAIDADPVTFTPPTGWTSIGKHTNTTDGQTTEAFVFRAGGSEPSTYTWTSDGGGTGLAGYIRCYSGVSTSTAIDVTTSINSGESASSPISLQATGVTTTTNNTMLVWIASTDAPAACTFTQPSSFLNTVSVTDLSTFVNLSGADLAQTTAGASGNKTGSCTFSGGGTSGWTCFLVALRSATP